MDQSSVLSTFRQSGALLEGHFRLTSGLHSVGYLQSALVLQNPPLAEALGRALAERIRDLRPTVVLSPALGGLIIGHEVAAALDLPFRFSERQDGRMVLRRGFEITTGERVAIVEDVVTTGRSTNEAAAAVRERGGEVVAVGAVIDRTGGSNPFVVAFEALTALTIDTWSAEDCPLCRGGSEPEKPGSRES